VVLTEKVADFWYTHSGSGAMGQRREGIARVGRVKYSSGGGRFHRCLGLVERLH
jgi:hypothetical protein